jgi:hypothetical protein
VTKERWLAARKADLLPIPYFHVVFTLPHDLNALAQGNPRVMYTLLFRAAADTLLTFGRDPRHLSGTTGSPRFCTPGGRISRSISISTALSPAGRWLVIAHAGSWVDRPSCFRSVRYRRCFARSISPVCNVPSMPAS